MFTSYDDVEQLNSSMYRLQNSLLDTKPLLVVTVKNKLHILQTKMKNMTSVYCK